MEEEITQKICEIRKAKGLSRENMAFDLEISTAAYRKVELHKTKLTVGRLFNISKILETPVWVLLGLEFPEKKTAPKTNEKHTEKLKNLYNQNLANEERIIKQLKETLREKDEIIKLLREETA